MEKTSKVILGIVIFFLLLIIFFPVFNFFITPKVPAEIMTTIFKLSSQNENDLDFLKASYNDLDNRFTSESNCWAKYYWRNYFVGTRVWKLQGECLPCHQHNNVLRAYLIESKRFSRSQTNTKLTVCWDEKVFHVYSEVTLKNGTVINVDQWGTEWNISLGQTIHDSEICKKK